MLNAFTVCIRRGRSTGWRKSESNERTDSSERRESKEIAPVIIASRLKTGEEWRRIEMVDHVKRQDILKIYNLAEAVGSMQ